MALRTIRPNSSLLAVFKSLRSPPQVLNFFGASKLSTTRQFSSTTANMSTKGFMDAVKARRSHYVLNKKVPVSDARLEEIVKETVLHTPSAFNSQTSRLVVLLKDDHDKFWEVVKGVLKPHVSAEQFAQTEKKLDGFKAGYGTILFLEDQDPVHDLEKKFALYADKFQQWSEHTSAMHQFVLWTALETEGFGCNLQHYNPVVDQKAQQLWKIPATWGLKAQLVFGGRAAEAGEKQFKPLEERLVFHGN